MLAIELDHIGWRIALFVLLLLLIPIFILRSRQNRRRQALRADASLQEMMWVFPERVSAWLEQEECWLIDPDPAPSGPDFAGPYLLQRPGHPIDQRIWGQLPASESSIVALRADLARAFAGEPAS